MGKVYHILNWVKHDREIITFRGELKRILCALC